MIQNYRISCGLPCCQTRFGEQTILSKGLRITAIALGGIGILGGILIVCNVPGFTQAGTIAGWPTFSGGCVLIVAGTSFKIVRLHTYQEVRGLDAVQSRDVYATLQDYLSQARAAVIDQRFRPEGDAFNQRVWSLAVYLMMLDSTLETEGCHPIVLIRDFSVKDAEHIDGIYTTDWFSTSDSPCLPVTLKKLINELSGEQQGNVFREGRKVDHQIDMIEEELETLSFYLQKRYPFVVSDTKPLTTNISFPQFIFNLIKECIQELEIANVDDLSDTDVSRQICDLLAIRLLSLCTPREEGILLFEDMELQFGMIERKDFFDPKIPNFLVNALTSFDNDDDPVVDVQPLELAVKLQKMRENEKENLIRAIKKRQPLNREIALLIQPISNLLLNRFYMKFMGTFLQQIGPRDEKSLEKDAFDPSKPIKNDIMCHTIRNMVDKHFTFEEPAIESEGTNCMLDAILDKVDGLSVKDMRDQMSAYFLRHKKELHVYFENDEALEEHAANLKRSFTMFEDVDFEVLARVIGHPLHIIKRDVETFFVDKDGVPVPAIFGPKGKKEIIYLFEDEGAHYVRLSKK